MTIILKEDGSEFDLIKAGIRTRDIIINSPTPIHLTEEMEGQNGLLDLETFLGSRDITVLFRMQAQDHIDFGLLRDEIFRVLRGDKYFYLIEKRNPGKRWKVKVKDPYNIPQQYVYGNFEVNLISFSPYSESIGTSLDPLTFEAEKWQVGQGIKLDDLSYSHNTREFSIYNAGDVSIDPRQKMHFKLMYQGQSNGLEIKNNTTGDVWNYSGQSTQNDTIKLEGIRSLKNDNSIFKDTNKKLITLAPGWNDFILTGTGSTFLVSFDFKFYYF